MNETTYTLYSYILMQWIYINKNSYLISTNYNYVFSTTATKLL
jgi:hypothetical protein